MDGCAFKKGIEKALVSHGFERSKRCVLQCEEGVWTLVAAEKGFGNQWFINVGFWLEQLGGEQPDRIETTHLYLRLERLFPQHRETIVVAGMLDDARQPQMYEVSLGLLVEKAEGELRTLGTEAGLRIAFAEGRLGHGLIRKEARELRSKENVCTGPTR